MQHKHTQPSGLVLSLALAWATSPTAWAQASTAEHGVAHRLDEVTITAEPFHEGALLAPAQQLSGAALTQRQGSTLGETLDQLPGVANSS